MLNPRVVELKLPTYEQTLNLIKKNLENNTIEGLKHKISPFDTTKEIFLYSFKELIKTNNLKTLSLDILNISDSELTLKTLESIESLQSLQLSFSFTPNTLESLQTIINQNPKLEKIDLEDNYLFTQSETQIQSFFDGLKENPSITSLVLDCNLFQDSKFLLKFQNLRFLSLNMETNLKEIINSIQGLSHLEMLDIKLRETIDYEVEFYKTSIKHYIFRGSLDSNSYVNLIKGVGKTSLIKTLNLFDLSCNEYRKSLSDYEWINEIKKVLLYSNIEGFSFSSIFFNKNELMTIYEGIEKNNTITYLDFSSTYFDNNLENNKKLSEYIGHILKSKKTLKVLKIRDHKFEMKEFMSEFKNVDYLKELLIHCNMDGESGKLFCEFVSNNSPLEVLSIYWGFNSNEFVDNMLNVISSHKKIKQFCYFSSQEISGKSVNSLLKNKNLEFLQLQKVTFQNQDFRIFLQNIMENNSLKSIQISLVNGKKGLKKKDIDLIERSLIYNYSLLEFKLKNIDYTFPFAIRNNSLLKITYKFSNLTKSLNIFFQFK